MNRNIFNILLKELDGKVLYDRNDQEMELTGLEAIKEHAPYYKPGRTVKYCAFDYFKALEEAFDDILEPFDEYDESSSTTLIYQLVEFWLCPKLNKEDKKSLDILDEKVREYIGCLGRIYYSPITYSQLDYILSYFDIVPHMDEDKHVFRLEKYVPERLKYRMEELVKLKYFLNGRTYPYLVLEIVERMEWAKSYNPNYLLDCIVS